MKNFRMYAKLAQKKPTSHIFITFLFSAVLLWHICNGTVPTQNRKWTVFFSFRWTLCMPNIDDAWYVNNKMIILIISSWQQRILIYFFWQTPCSKQICKNHEEYLNHVLIQRLSEYQLFLFHLIIFPLFTVPYSRQAIRMRDNREHGWYTAGLLTTTKYTTDTTVHFSFNILHTIHRTVSMKCISLLCK